MKNLQFIDINTLTDEHIEKELFVRYEDGFKHASVGIKHRVLRFKATQILLGDPEGLPFRKFDPEEAKNEKHELQTFHEDIQIKVCRATAKKEAIRGLFTPLVFLFGRTYYLNAIQPDEDLTVILRGINELLESQFGEVIKMKEAESEEEATEVERWAPSQDIQIEAEEVERWAPPHNDIQITIEVEQPQPQRERTCFRCGTTGHYKANCNQRRIRRPRVRGRRGGPTPQGMPSVSYPAAHTGRRLSHH